MSISKLVDDYNTTEIALVSIRYRFRPCQRENQIKRCSDGEQSLQTDIGMVPRPELRYLWYPCGFLGGFM